jgi:hypothetical protein
MKLLLRKHGEVEKRAEEKREKRIISKRNWFCSPQKRYSNPASHVTCRCSTFWNPAIMIPHFPFAAAD